MTASSAGSTPLTTAAKLIVVWLAVSAPRAQAQLRIVDYNTGGVNNQSALETIIEAIGNEAINGVAKPIDVLTVQEQEFVTTHTQTLVNLLNGIYGADTYARSTVNGATNGSGRPALIYNTQTVQLIDEVQIGNTSGSGAARAPMRYQLRPAGYDATADFYIYNSHYKADDGTSDQNRRNVEAQTIRANADALGQGTHVIYAGDFNIYYSSEPMWGTLTAAGNGQAFDPINRVGDWHSNNFFRNVHTQSPVTDTAEHYPGQTGGGMNDRFDWQMTTEEFFDGDGLSYLIGSYQAFGNNGSHSLHGDINAASNTAQPPAVLDALAHASDHIPVVAQYQVPAKMGVAVAAVPSQVVVGASLAAEVTVTNTAGDNPALVAAVIGADELSYTVAATGAAAGSVNGTDQALGGANVHAFPLNTEAAGAMSAAFTTTATSAQVPDGVQFNDVNYSVLDHANASFASDDDVNTLTIDFGEFTVDSGAQQQTFALHNLMATAGFTAALDLLSVTGAGDTDVLTTNLTSLDDLPAGGSENFLASLDTATAGDFAASYTLNFSDDTALPGALGGQVLTLNLLGLVDSAPPMIPGDFDGDGDVDGADFVVWQTNFPTEMDATLATGDADGDGDVDGADFVIWQTNFPTTPGPSTAPVPEPAAVTLAAIALTLLVRRRTRKC